MEDMKYKIKYNCQNVYDISGIRTCYAQDTFANVQRSFEDGEWMIENYICDSNIAFGEVDAVERQNIIYKDEKLIANIHDTYITTYLQPFDPDKDNYCRVMAKLVDVMDEETENDRRKIIHMSMVTPMMCNTDIQFFQFYSEKSWWEEHKELPYFYETVEQEIGNEWHWIDGEPDLYDQEYIVYDWKSFYRPYAYELYITLQEKKGYDCEENLSKRYERFLMDLEKSKVKESDYYFITLATTNYAKEKKEADSLVYHGVQELIFCDPQVIDIEILFESVMNNPIVEWMDKKAKELDASLLARPNMYTDLASIGMKDKIENATFDSLYLYNVGQANANCIVGQSGMEKLKVFFDFGEPLSRYLDLELDAQLQLNVSAKNQITNVIEQVHKMDDIDMIMISHWHLDHYELIYYILDLLHHGSISKEIKFLFAEDARDKNVSENRLMAYLTQYKNRVCLVDKKRGCKIKTVSVNNGNCIFELYKSVGNSNEENSKSFLLRVNNTLLAADVPYGDWPDVLVNQLDEIEHYVVSHHCGNLDGGKKRNDAARVIGKFKNSNRTCYILAGLGLNHPNTDHERLLIAQFGQQNVINVRAYAQQNDTNGIEIKL